MTETITVVEGQWSEELALSESEVSDLRRLGRLFSSSSSDDDDEKTTSVEVRRVSPFTFQVKVSNAIGTLATASTRFVVAPKIRLDHLVHFLVRSGRLPKSAAAPSAVSSADFLWPLVAAWCLDEIEALRRQGFRRGYESQVEDLSAFRGRLLVVQTTLRMLQGDVRMRCEFSEHTLDTPLNRVLREATRLVARSIDLGADLRMRARRLLTEFGGVDQMRPSDMRATPDRTEEGYVAAFDLARHVVRSNGRTAATGSSRAQAFLVRTPGAVEDSLRSIAAEALAGLTTVSKRSLLLQGAATSLNPDLVFGDPSIAVGDVKYKVWDGGWNRTDLYQLVAFAAGFQVARSVRVGMTDGNTCDSSVAVGGHRLDRCDWRFDLASPAAAEKDFQDRIRAWWLADETPSGASHTVD